MTSSENIRNALQVLYKTYENIQKLMDYTKIVAQEKTNYRPSVTKFLRYKSDNNANGWLTNDFILLFQNNTDPHCANENGWKDAPVYALEIFLSDENGKEDTLPSIYLSKFEYNDINSWSEGCSPANHWVFYYPLRNEDYINLVQHNEYWVGTPKNEKASSTYRGLKKVVFYKLDLMSITSTNLKEMIFDRFDLLKEVDF